MSTSNKFYEFEALYRQYFHWLLNHVTYFTHDRTVAEDITQQTFYSIYSIYYKEVDTIEVYAPKLFLLTIARRFYIDLCRQNKTVLNKENNLIQYQESCFQSSERCNEIFQLAMVNLEQHERDIFILSYFYGYTQKEIAANLEIPLKTYKLAMKKALRKMEFYLKDAN